MRLKLVSKTPMDDPAEKGWRLLERGELTLGRAPGCGWKLDDADRTLSKLHCRIVRDAQGFKLRDESTNGVTVDGVDLAEGQSVRLSNGSSVAFCGLAFAVEITGEAEPDWTDPSADLPMGDEPLTITSIIADVAPGGRTANGLIPGRTGDDWLDAQAGGAAPSKRAERHADLGWSGPPQPQLLHQALPDDWNAASEIASRTEHLPATTVRMRTPKPVSEQDTPPTPAHSPVAPDDAADALVAAFLDGAKLSPGLSGDPAVFLRVMGRTLRAALDRVSALEAGATEFLAEHGVDRPVTGAADDPARLGERLDQLLDDQRVLHDSIAAAFHDVAQRFDPRGIEARVDAKAAGAQLLRRQLHELPLIKERAYWTAYRAAYGDGREDGGLRDQFRETLRSRDDTRRRDGFEELSADDQKG